MGPPVDQVEHSAVKRSVSVKKKRDPPLSPTPARHHVNGQLFLSTNNVNSIYGTIPRVHTFNQLPIKQMPPYDIKANSSVSNLQQQQQANESFDIRELLTSRSELIPLSQMQSQQNIAHPRQQSMPSSFPSSSLSSPPQAPVEPAPRTSVSGHTSPQNAQYINLPFHNPKSPTKPSLPTSPTLFMRHGSASSAFEFPTTSASSNQPSHAQQRQNIHQIQQQRSISRQQSMLRHEQSRQQQQQTLVVQQQQLMHQQNLQKLNQQQHQHQLQNHQLHQQNQLQQNQPLQNGQQRVSSPNSFYPHYPTPPSHSSEATPQHLLNSNSHDSFPTPSPESPGENRFYF